MIFDDWYLIMFDPVCIHHRATHHLRSFLNFCSDFWTSLNDFEVLDCLELLWSFGCFWSYFLQIVLESFDLRRLFVELIWTFWNVWEAEKMCRRVAGTPILKISWTWTSVWRLAIWSTVRYVGWHRFLGHFYIILWTLKQMSVQMHVLTYLCMYVHVFIQM